MTGKKDDHGVAEEVIAIENTDITTESKRKCCDLYNGNTDAIGYTFLGVGRGMMVMSNIFMSGSLLWLSSNAAGCIDDEDTNEGPCDKRVYGMLPSTLITSIATVSGLASACLMPIAGAFVDYLPYRRHIGIISAIIMTLIQGIQIYTVQSTWFAMALLQALAIVIYQLQVVTVYAYLPDMARQVGEKEMTRFSSHFTAIQFIAQLFFLVVMAAITIFLKPTIVMTGQISQGFNTVTCVIFFSIGWFKYMSPRPAVHDLQPGASLCALGFRQVWKTAKTIRRHYKKGLRWYYLALCFAEASAAAVTTLSVVYLNETLNMDPTEVAIFYMATLVACPLGSYLGRLITNKSNPNTSWKFSMVAAFIVLLIGVLVLEDVPLVYSNVWGFCVGITLGWFYSTENLFFALCLPKGQEAELVGFFVFCSQVLVWIPPILFSVSVENNLQQKYGLIIANTFFLVATVVLMFTGSWDEILEEAATGIVILGEGNDGAEKPM